MEDEKRLRGQIGLYEKLTAVKKIPALSKKTKKKRNVWLTSGRRVETHSTSSAKLGGAQITPYSGDLHNCI